MSHTFTTFFSAVPPVAGALSGLTIVAYMGAYVAAASAQRKASALNDTAPSPIAAVRALLWLAWALHLGALVTTFVHAARFGFATALSMTAWLVLTLYAIEQQLYPRMRALAVLCALGAAGVVLTLIFPGKPLDMQRSQWLALHLALGIASYGLLAAAVVHAALMARTERLMRLGAHTDAGMPLLVLERLTFRFVTAGFVLLSATLLVGWMFGETLYGRALLWEHKTVFSVLAWAAFAFLLIARQRFGWRGRAAVHTIYVGAGLLLLAYAGSRFVLEVLLG